MFSSPAFAQTAGAGGGAEALQAFLPIILIFVVFYFLLIRPQQKRLKDQKAMLTAIRRGDRIVIGGGIIGLVSKVIDDNELLVEIAENTRVRVQRQMVATVLTKADAPRDADGGAVVKADPGATAPSATPQSGKSSLSRLFGGKNR